MLRLPAVHSSPVHYTIRPEFNHFASEKSIDIRHGTSKRIAFSKDTPQAQLCGKCIVDCAWSCLFWNLCSHGKQRVAVVQIKTRILFEENATNSIKNSTTNCPFIGSLSLTSSLRQVLR